MNKKNFLSGFWLRIIAIITMTFDHIGLALAEYAVISSSGWLYTSLRILGRLSLPLFAFGIVQGIIHTRNQGKYLTRLGVSMLVMTLGIFLVDQFTDFNVLPGNIFIDLFFGALIIGFLTLPKYKKLFVLIPIALIPLLLLGQIPVYVKPLYHVYGIAMIICFYLAHLLAKCVINHYSLTQESSEDNRVAINIENIFAFASLVLINCVFYIIGLYSNYLYDYLNISLQMYSILSGAFLLFYTGTRGYNRKWFQYGCYLYYPLHVIIIFGLTFLLT